MTYGENKKITLALLDEYSSSQTNYTDSDDLVARLPFLYNLAYKELSMNKKILATKKYNESSVKEDKFTKYTLPSDLYQTKDIFAIDSDNKPINTNYYIVNKDIYINNLVEGTTILEYYRYPSEINENTSDSFYLELDEDVQAFLPYKVADDILKTDPSADYSAFAQEYQRKLQTLDGRKNIPMVTLNEPDYDV